MKSQCGLRRNVSFLGDAKRLEKVRCLRAEPKEVRDLMIAANNAWFLTFDNLTKVPGWLSDALCRMATGGGFSCRKLYSDRDEVTFSAKRPTLLTGIGTPADRSDLLDRAVVIELPVIPATQRRSEADLWTQFEVAKPYILGAICDGVSAALKNWSTTVLPELPRMADFARWVTAAECGLGWKSGTFLEAYNSNRRMTNEEVLQDHLAIALRTLMKTRTDWQGTAAELLQELGNTVNDEVKHSTGWPRDARSLSSQIDRLAPSLRASGIDFERPSRTSAARLLRFTNQSGSLALGA